MICSHCLGRRRGIKIFLAFISLGFDSFTTAAWSQGFTGFSVLNSPSVVPAISPQAAPIFSPAPGVNCPTPAFTLAGYGANSGNWVDYPGNADASSGLGNHGVVAGISIPLGGSLSRYCNDFALALLRQQQEDAFSRRINNQAKLVNTCLALKNLVDFNDKAFDSPEFESLRDCRILQNALRNSTSGAPSIPKGDSLESTPKPDVQLFLPIR
jgi:hypothetical protein